MAFLSSKRDARIPVPNRYFGVFQDGEIKYRGIELRCHDTPPWVAKTQLAVLQCLAQAQTLAQVREYIPQAREIVAQAKRGLRGERVPLEDLLITQRLSREVDSYKSPSPASRAARQWIESGKPVAPGQVMQFVYTRGVPGVWAYGCGALDGRTVDVGRYVQLAERAIRTILDCFFLPRDEMDLENDPLPGLVGRACLEDKTLPTRGAFDNQSVSISNSIS